MGETSAERPNGGLLNWAVGGMGLIGVAVAVTIIGLASCKPAPGGVDLKSAAKGQMAKLNFDGAGHAPPPTQFFDAAGKAVTLADFKGKVVVVNLWATWCAPCKIEMPTIAKMAKAYEGKNLTVVPVSVDGASEVEKAKLELAKHPPLTFYNDPKLALPYAFNPPSPGMPTTIVFGPDGLERARFSGEADWSGPDAKAFLDAVLAGG